VVATPSLTTTSLAFLNSINTTQNSSGTTLLAIAGFSSSSTALANWSFNAGAEFAGAKGCITYSTSSNGNAVALNADLGCTTTSVVLTPSSGCGKYVGAVWTPSSLLSVPSPSTNYLLTKYRSTQPMLTAGLRLTDSGGQVLQYRLPVNTLEGVAGAPRVTALVKLSSPTSYWGGANNGVPQGGLQSIAGIAGQMNIVGPASSMLINQWRLLDSNSPKLALTGQETLLTSGVIASTQDRLSTGAPYYRSSDTALQMAANAGFTVIRTDLLWEVVQPAGSSTFDFSVYDAMLTRLANHGQKAIFILDYGNSGYGS
jgi:hypothetical protein